MNPGAARARAPVTARVAPAPYRWLIALASRLAPPDARAEWRREWTSEICFALGHGGHRPRILWRTLWCALDALAMWQREISMTGWLTDLSTALRSMRRTPALVITIVLTLGIAVTITTTMFSVVDTVLLRRLPLPDDHRLVRFWQERPASNLRNWPYSYAMFREVAATIDSAEVAAHSGAQFNALIGDEPVHVTAARVSHSFFPVTGLPLAAGRSFSREEEARGLALAIVSHEFWRDSLGADPGALGRTIVLGGTPHDVVGITAPGSDLLSQINLRIGAPGQRVDVFIPLEKFGAMQADLTSTLQIVGRLADGASVEQARGEVFAVVDPFLTSRGSDGWQTHASTMREFIIGPARNPLLVLFGAVGVLLLLVCASLGGLVLVRSVARRDEWSTRRLLGASHARLARQLFTETSVLALLGGGLGLALTFWLVSRVRASAPLALPRASELSVDWRTALFAGAVAVVATMLFGLVPALATARRSRLVPTSGFRQTLSRQTRQMLRAMVVVQVGLAMVLLAGSGVLVRSLTHLLAQDPGYHATGVAHGIVGLPVDRYGTDDAVRQFTSEVLQQVAGRPDVVHAAVASILLPTQGPRIRFQRADISGQDGAGIALQSAVSPGFFDVLGIQMVAGRGFTSADRAGAPGVAVITQALADRFWPDENPVGRSILVGSWRTFSTTGASAPQESREIVGVTADLTGVGIDPGAPVEMLFAPFDQDPWSTHGYLLKASGDPVAVLPGLREAVASADPRQSVSDAGHLLDTLRQDIGRERASTTLLLLFAALALVVALLGTYGVVAHAVALRHREIGLRIALGAAPRAIFALVAREGLAPVAIGMAVGVPTAALAVGFLRELLFEIQPIDPVAFTGACVVLGLLALVAAILPARRTARVDPWTALRPE